MGSFISQSLNAREMGPNYFTDLPEEILEAIFIRIEPIDLIRKVQFVCRSWRDVVNRPSTWRQLALRHNLTDPATLRGVTDYKRYFFLLTRNLILNGWADQSLKHWEHDLGRNSNGFAVEECYPVSAYCQPLPEEARYEYASTGNKADVVHCWATTYYLCEKSQTIDLVKVGLSPELLDSDDRPAILVSSWTAARKDCASIYRLTVTLLAEDKRSPLDQITREVYKPQWMDGSWEKVSHLFSPLPVGVRYVHFCHNGKDDQFWAGHYGPKFTGATVKIVFKSKFN